jgi:branched-chain amino acid transport system ATP-binding protein
MLEVQGLRVGYGKVEAVRGVDLAVARGEVHLVLGANGAGKTTTLKAIAGLMRPRGGSVRLADAEVTGESAHRMVRRGLVLVPEGRRIFAPLSVEENLRLGGYTASKAARADTLSRVYDTFPILRDRRSGPAGLLSGGEQQMLAFGRALMAQPTVMLMDEPSMGLAPTMVETILGAVRDIAASDIAVLMVEQNAELGLEVADRVSIFARGEKVFAGGVEEARSRSSVVMALLGETALGADTLVDQPH